MTKGEETRARILKFAIREFGAFGLHHATLDQIAKKAKVHKPLIVHYFTNKNRLLISAIGQVMEDFSRILAGLEHPNMSARQKLHQIFESNMLLARDYPDSTRLIIILYATATWDDAFRDLSDRVAQGARGRYLIILKEAVQEAALSGSQNMEAKSRIIHSWIVGAMIDFLKGNQNFELEKSLRSDWKTLVRGLFRPRED